MKDLYVKKIFNGFIVDDSIDIDKLNSFKIKLGDYCRIKIETPRNIGHHRKYFVLIRLCFENQTKFSNKDHLRKYLQMKAGYYEVVNTGDGEMILPLSISFDSMGQLEFDELYSKVLDQVIKLLGCDKEDIFEILKDF